MALDYKRELEEAARNMILVHEPELLLKLIIRMLVQKVSVSHAGILLHVKDKDSYVLTVSRGPAGIKIPEGFARLDSDNPLIKFFINREDKKIFNNGSLVYSEAKDAVLGNELDFTSKELLNSALYQMEIFEAVACIPSYYRDELLGILLLGHKKDGKEFSRDELSFFSALASDVAMAIRNAQLFKELELQLQREKRLFIHTTIALAAAIDAKDHYTHGHTERVSSICLEIARKLMEKSYFRIDDKFIENLHIASLLHDIGKIGIPESILNKKGPLDDDERKVIKSHPVVGVNILIPIRELEDAILGVKYHHERYDGTGYPEGLKGEEIPLIAAIISVADSFDAMTTNRPYHEGLTNEEAVKEIETLAGKQFHPQISAVFTELYKEGKI
ncbi:MAG: HD domain-containing protein [Candidatus Omnitrophota bacterium]|jgi:HD-GYP domain-containing protein (c-di-GMP phosphodiesterase class II)|nr:MAG: HD domain-containing protein [Candidatus Omnitrophota bacterium]